MKNMPSIMRIHEPIMQELYAVSGSDDVRFLYERLVAYFPHLDEEVLQGKLFDKWRLAVQKAGRELDAQGFIKREKGVWTLTASGEKHIRDENADFRYNADSLVHAETKALSHTEIQQIIESIGQVLNFHTQKEYEFYDVVWRASQNSPRLSHVFEVQSKGNLDSALAKLKRAYEAQRSNIFLVLTRERDVRRVSQSLQREFHDLEKILTVLTFEQIRSVFQSLEKISNILPKLLKV